MQRQYCSVPLLSDPWAPHPVVNRHICSGGGGLLQSLGEFIVPAITSFIAPELLPVEIGAETALNAGEGIATQQPFGNIAAGIGEGIASEGLATGGFGLAGDALGGGSPLDPSSFPSTSSIDNAIGQGAGGADSLGGTLAGDAAGSFGAGADALNMGGAVDYFGQPVPASTGTAGATDAFGNVQPGGGGSDFNIVDRFGDPVTSPGAGWVPDGFGGFVQAGPGAAAGGFDAAAATAAGWDPSVVDPAGNPVAPPPADAGGNWVPDGSGGWVQATPDVSAAPTAAPTPDATGGPIFEPAPLSPLGETPAPFTPPGGGNFEPAPLDIGPLGTAPTPAAPGAPAPADAGAGIAATGAPGSGADAVAGSAAGSGAPAAGQTAAAATDPFGTSGIASGAPGTGTDLSGLVPDTSVTDPFGNTIPQGDGGPTGSPAGPGGSNVPTANPTGAPDASQAISQDLIDWSNIQGPLGAAQPGQPLGATPDLSGVGGSAIPQDMIDWANAQSPLGAVQPGQPLGATGPITPGTTPGGSTLGGVGTSLSQFWKDNKDWLGLLLGGAGIGRQLLNQPSGATDPNALAAIQAQIAQALAGLHTGTLVPAAQTASGTQTKIATGADSTAQKLLTGELTPAQQQQVSNNLQAVISQIASRYGSLGMGNSTAAMEDQAAAEAASFAGTAATRQANINEGIQLEQIASSTAQQQVADALNTSGISGTETILQTQLAQDEALSAAISRLAAATLGA